MHQPVYKSDQNGIYLMPWVRLRAVKDYLDMLLVMDKFPGLKLNFNLVPLLISSIYDYGYNNAHDIYSRLTITPVEELSDDEKEGLKTDAQSLADRVKAGEDISAVAEEMGQTAYDLTFDSESTSPNEDLIAAVDVFETEGETINMAPSW